MNEQVIPIGDNYKKSFLIESKKYGGTCKLGWGQGLDQNI